MTDTTIECATPTTTEAPPAGKPEALDIPNVLKLPAAERKEAWKGRRTIKPKEEVKTTEERNLPKSIEPAGREILKQQEQIKKESKERRLRELRESAEAKSPKRAAEDRAAKKKEAQRKLQIKTGTVAQPDLRETKKTNGTPVSADPKKREVQVDKLARQEVKAKKPAAKALPKKTAGNGKTIGGVAREAILAGATNEQALAKVMKAFPDCSSNVGCMSWYRNDLRKKGELKPPRKAAR